MFMDIDMIEPGEDFVEVIEGKLADAVALVVLVGRDWLNCKDTEGRSRLENPDDFVRLEVVTALRRNVRVIPVLIDDAQMPTPQQLPDDLAPLSRRQAIRISHARFHQDVTELIDVLEKLLTSAGKSTEGGQISESAKADRSDAQQGPAKTERLARGPTFAVNVRILAAIAGLGIVVLALFVVNRGSGGSNPSAGFSTAAVLVCNVLGVLVVLGGSGYLIWHLRQRLPVKATLTDMNEPGKVYHLRRRLSYLGRDPSCDVVIKHPKVGRRHATIRLDEAKVFWLRDLNSRHGTWLNGVRLASGPPAGEEILRGGDMIRFPGFSFLFAAEEGTQTELADRMPEAYSFFCPNHASQPSVEPCDECRKMFCRNCIEPVGERLLCPDCRRNEIPTQSQT